MGGAFGESGLLRDGLEGYLEPVVRRLADGITVLDARGRIVYANDAAVRMIGFSSEEELRQMPAEEVLERFEILDEDGLPLYQVALFEGFRRDDDSPHALFLLFVIL